MSVVNYSEGIGLETAKELALHGATIYMLCRNVKAAETVARQIESTTGKAGQCHVIQCDLSKLDSVRKCAKEVLKQCPKIHVLINNAGMVACE